MLGAGRGLCSLLVAPCENERPLHPQPTGPTTWFVPSFWGEWRNQALFQEPFILSAGWGVRWPEPTAVPGWGRAEAYLSLRCPLEMPTAHQHLMAAFR